MSSTMKLAEFLFSRLGQLGVGSVHGVPGDYNLTLLDYVEPSGLQWVGNANELNAAYAADAYARIKGIGALLTTFGVGELSAVNAIAGAYAERAAVVHIVGIPPRAAQDSRLLIHHTFNDGEYRRFAQIHSHLTVAQTCLLDPRTSPKQIDDTLRQCLLHSRPVYIEVPVDLVAAPVTHDGSLLSTRIPEPTPDPALDDVLEKISGRIQHAKQPMILVDGEARPMGILDNIQVLIDSTNWPTWTTPFGKGLLDETVGNFHGVYQGKFDTPEVQSFVNEADLALCFGPHFSATNSSSYSSIPNPEVTIYFTDTEVKFGKEVFRDIPARYITSRLTNLDFPKVEGYEPYPSLPRDYLVSFDHVSGDQPITQNKIWRLMANFLRPGDIVFGETGTAGYGVREMALPKHTRVFTPVTWLSIGYMLPGSQGAALAQRELVRLSDYHGAQNPRTILLIGDGSFQMTAQELATIIRHNLNVIVFLINNDGYTIERCIHGRSQGYNDISPWRYLQAPSFFGAKEDTYTASASTWSDLEKVLGEEKLRDGTGLRMVEVFMDREDAPTGLLTKYLKDQKARDCNSKAG